MSSRRPGSDLAAQLADDGPVAKDGRRGRLTVRSKRALDNSDLGIDTVLAKIQAAYIAGLRRCYERHLRNDPSARGTLALGFTVSKRGDLLDLRIETFHDDVRGCASNALLDWRFPPPKGTRNGEARFEVVFDASPE